MDARRWARVRPEHVRHLPSFRAGEWYPVLDQPPPELHVKILAGYLWVDLDGRPRSVWAAHFEFRDTPP
jgi:hypothetical protein